MACELTTLKEVRVMSGADVEAPMFPANRAPPIAARSLWFGSKLIALLDDHPDCRRDAAGMLVEYLMGTGSGERRTQERGSTDDVQADKAAAAETFSPESSGGGMRKRTETQRGKTAR